MGGRKGWERVSRFGLGGVGIGVGGGGQQYIILQ